MKLEDLIYVGTVIGTHGIKGEVKVFSESDFKDERFKVENQLWLHSNDEWVNVTIKSHRNHKGNDLILFNDVSSINDVLSFINAKLYVGREQLTELEEGSYYYTDLIDCHVLTKQGRRIGTVIDVVNYGASDILVIKRDDGEEVMVPFVDEFIDDVDEDNQQITIIPIEGLLGDWDAD